MIRFKCSECGQRLHAVREWAKRRVRCPSCQQVTHVPEEHAPGPASAKSKLPMSDRMDAILHFEG
ncbi:MAG: hypothetical protein GC164_11460 [Phycisphaera sp.]|nr:hypothetical protein [Phycisphaera sp.]